MSDVAGKNFTFDDQRNEWLVLSFALVYPSILTLVYFVLLQNTSKTAQQLAYGIGKGIQFGLPLIWAGWICRETLRWPPFSSRGLAAGIGFGLVIAGAIFGLYFGYFKAAGT